MESQPAAARDAGPGALWARRTLGYAARAGLLAAIAMVGVISGAAQTAAPAVEAQATTGALQKAEHVADRIEEGVEHHSGPLLQQYHGQVHGYKVTFQPFTLSVDPFDGGPGRLETRTSLAKTTFSRQGHWGQWTTENGLHGAFVIRQNVGFGPAPDPAHESPLHRDFVGPELVGFQNWQRTLSGPSPDGPARGLRDELHGLKSDWHATVETREGAEVHLNSTGLEPFYRVFAGVQKIFPMKIFGKDRSLSTKFGPQLEGTRERPAHVGPAFDVELRW